MTQLCNDFTQYIYGVDLNDQISNRKILGREFCNGVVSISTMDLPFSSQVHGIHNANDGMLLVNIVEEEGKKIVYFLTKMKQNAETASTSANSDEKRYLDQEFQQMMSMINNISANTHFFRIAVLSGGNLDILIHGKSAFIRISLPDLTIGKVGLDISGHNLRSRSSAKAAIPVLTKAINIASDKLAALKEKIPEINEARKKDAVITSVDLSGEEFIIKKTGPSFVS